MKKAEVIAAVYTVYTRKYAAGALFPLTSMIPDLWFVELSTEVCGNPITIDVTQIQTVHLNKSREYTLASICDCVVSLQYWMIRLSKMGRSKRKAGSDDHDAQSKKTKQKYVARYQAAWMLIRSSQRGSDQWQRTG